MPYGVLLATRDQDLENQIRDLFSESEDFTVLRSVSTTIALDAQIAEREPDLVLLHENLGPAPVLAINRDLLERWPTLAVVLISRDDSAGMLAAAMEAGARGVVTLPVSFTDVQTRLSSAASWSMRVRSRLADEDPENAAAAGTIVAVAGAKGGCGASTVAAQLALAATRSPGRRVCLVDLDLQAGDVGGMFSVRSHHDISDLVEVADELTRGTVAGMLFRHPCGLRVLPAPALGERADLVSSGAVRRVLGVLRTMFDAVVVDCGTTASQANLGAVEIADRMLVISTPDVLSLRGAQRQTQLWDRLQVRKQADCEVVLNRTGRTSVVQPALARRVVESPLAPVSVPARFRRLEESTNLGSAEAVTDRRLARSFRRLARHAGLLETGEQAPDPRADDGVLQTFQFALVVPALVLLVSFVLQCLLVGTGALVAQRTAIDTAQGLEQGRSTGTLIAIARERLPHGFAIAGVQDAGDRVRVQIDVPTLIPGFHDLLQVDSSSPVGSR